MLTPLQNILLTNVQPRQRLALEAHLRDHGVSFRDDLTPIARWSMARVALPTCGLALSEAERSRKPIVDGIEGLLRQHGLEQERISVRITGCPNGCARPYEGDLGIVGRAPGSYAIFVGGDFEGTRLNFLLFERIKQAEITNRLAPIVAAWANGRTPGEGFGDFCHRTGKEALLALAAPQLLAAAE